MIFFKSLQLERWAWLWMFFVLILCSFFSPSFAQDEQSFVTSLRDSHHLILQKKWSEAERALLKKDQTFSPGEVHYNLGVIYYRQSHWAKAIFHFQQAVLSLPRFGDARKNLRMSLKQNHDAIEEHLLYSWPEKLRLWIPLNMTELLILSLLCHLSFWIFFFWQKERFKKTKNVLGIASFILMTIMVVRMAVPYRFGVVQGTQANVYSGPSTDNVVLFQLHQGTKFFLIEMEDDLSLWPIQLADGKKGWIQKASILAASSP